MTAWNKARCVLVEEAGMFHGSSQEKVRTFGERKHCSQEDPAEKGGKGGWKPSQLGSMVMEQGEVLL